MILPVENCGRKVQGRWTLGIQVGSKMVVLGNLNINRDGDLQVISSNGDYSQRMWENGGDKWRLLFTLILLFSLDIFGIIVYFWILC